MIKRSFTRGAALRRIFIDGRKMTYLGAELNNVPLTIDLDKLDEEEDKIKKMGFDIEILKELANLKTEKDLIDDMTKDFRKSGWRRLNG